MGVELFLLKIIVLLFMMTYLKLKMKREYILKIKWSLW